MKGTPGNGQRRVRFVERTGSSGSCSGSSRFFYKAGPRHGDFHALRLNGTATDSADRCWNCCETPKCEGVQSTAANYAPVVFKNCVVKVGKWEVKGALTEVLRVGVGLEPVFRLVASQRPVHTQALSNIVRVGCIA